MRSRNFDCVGFRILAAVMLVGGCGSSDDSAGATPSMGDPENNTVGEGSPGAPLGDGMNMGGDGVVAEPPAPPEVELDPEFELPHAGERYVYAVNPQSDTVAVIDASTLAIHTVPAGREPRFLQTLGGTDSAIVLNVASNDATVIRTEEGHSEYWNVPVRPGANAIAVAPDGQHAVVYFDARYSGDGLSAGNFQDVTVLTLAPEGVEATQMTVGYRPSAVSFDAAASQAFVVTENGVSILDFAAIDQQGAGQAPTVSMGNSIDDPGTDVSVTLDGLYAVGRQLGGRELRLVELESRESLVLDIVAIVESALEAASPPLNGVGGSSAGGTGSSGVGGAGGSSDTGGAFSQLAGAMGLVGTAGIGAAAGAAGIGVVAGSAGIGAAGAAGIGIVAGSAGIGAAGAAGIGVVAGSAGIGAAGAAGSAGSAGATLGVGGTIIVADGGQAGLGGLAATAGAAGMGVAATGGLVATGGAEQVPAIAATDLITDVDLSPDSHYVVAVVRYAGAVVRIPVPQGFVDPSLIELTFIPEGRIGQVRLTEDGSRGLLFTTSDPRDERLTILDFDSPMPPRAVDLHKAISQVAVTEDGRTAFIVHQLTPGLAAESVEERQVNESHGYSLVNLDTGFPKLEITPTQVKSFTLVADAGSVFLTFESPTEVHRVGLADFVQRTIALASVPVAIGPVPQSKNVFVSQQHPDGRITFIDWATSAVNTITGFELNSTIRETP